MTRARPPPKQRMQDRAALDRSAHGAWLRGTAGVGHAVCPEGGDTRRQCVRDSREAGREALQHDAESTPVDLGRDHSVAGRRSAHPPNVAPRLRRGSWHSPCRVAVAGTLARRDGRQVRFFWRAGIGEVEVRLDERGRSAPEVHRRGRQCFGWNWPHRDGSWTNKRRTRKASCATIGPIAPLALRCITVKLLFWSALGVRVEEVAQVWICELLLRGREIDADGVAGRFGCWQCGETDREAQRERRSACGHRHHTFGGNTLQDLGLTALCVKYGMRWTAPAKSLYAKCG